MTFGRNFINPWKQAEINFDQLSNDFLQELATAINYELSYNLPKNITDKKQEQELKQDETK